MPLKSVLEFQFAHAKARDAVHRPLEIADLEAALGASPVVTVQSLATNGEVYLRRPDLGRRLNAQSHKRLTSAGRGYDLVFVIADGLSASAIHAHAVALMAACLPYFEDLKIAPIVIAKHGRVAIGDDIGACLAARLSVVFIGERPGLSVADSLGVYLTYGPERGRRDSERNCISNVDTHNGTSYAQAARKMDWLIREALQRELTGVDLKEDFREPALLESTPVNAPDQIA
jgi:ethanolamine ammonia-lyase small subunit